MPYPLLANRDRYTHRIATSKEGAVALIETSRTRTSYARISIFGMGYVGAVCSACLADAGHDVIGVDISALKVDLINRGKSPVVEPGLEELLKKQIEEGRLRAMSDTGAAIREPAI